MNESWRLCNDVQPNDQIPHTTHFNMRVPPSANLRVMPVIVLLSNDWRIASSSIAYLSNCNTYVDLQYEVAATDSAETSSTSAEVVHQALRSRSHPKKLDEEYQASYLLQECLGSSRPSLSVLTASIGVPKRSLFDMYWSVAS